MKTYITCSSCRGTGMIYAKSKSGFTRMTFVVPAKAKSGILAELDRIIRISGINIKDEVVARGVALELMSILSSTTTEEELE